MNAAATLPAFPLAVCAEMVFLDLPFEERVRRIADLGFAVEIWSWQDKDIAALAGSGATFSSMTGYVHGNIVETDAAKTLLETAEETLEVAAELGCPRLVVHPAELVDGKAAKPMFRVSGEMWLTALRTPERLAERARVTYCLENLNTALDVPGMPIGRAKDTLGLVETVGSPHGRMGRSARCRWPTCRGAAGRGRARSTTRPSPARSDASATPGRSGSRRTPRATTCRRSNDSAPPYLTAPHWQQFTTKNQGEGR